MFEQSLAHQPAGTVHRAAAHPRLPRGRRRAGGTDRGVDRFEHDVVDAEHGTGDLLGEDDEALTYLGRRELQRRHAVDQATAGGREVVEAFRVHQVLDRHSPADAATDVRRVGGQAGAAGEVHRVTVEAADRRVGQREFGRHPNAFGNGATFSMT
jgi:hypothetical protein